ncbi:MAG: LacI family DNA-binding transcriptional regulator [Gammaproteobacteria bacterium]|nr:LacI family DNA-binding transcriptional regulator [Gammaproteobacteria bacterium]NNF48797.1 LacI family DNA-binding transcriptional regulator [Woeseiaceae bacterium]MBT8094721.1 LacI family DNA-binding transcriptional regulator [Gammaproteobacteria bacterium]MBT8104316.1 LacI family DNA-binding transcriptional regulator [Gammaproteobacteria bacterium]NNK24332.1 LacI family DNA-binding transcriptional regulator [Woeseiaceae bacterium]
MKVDNPTSRDIAELAGVSQATVSRALRNSPLVRDETRERVQKIARDLNYFVNRSAARLRTQQSNTIALLLFDETEGEDAQINPFFLSMLGYISRAASGLGYDVLVSIQQLSDDWHIEYQASNRADGLILLGYGDYTSYREKLAALAEANTRFTIWGPKIGGEPGHSLGCDNVDGGYQATRHLLENGRQRIALLGTTSQRSPELAARYDGYCKALREAGIEPDEQLIVDASSADGEGYRAILELLERGVEFDAVFAVTDVIAIDAMRALEDNGLSVPRDVAVVGFDDVPLAAYVTPPLTTVRQDIRQAAEGLVRGIVGLIEGEPVESSLMAPKLVVRASCGAL